MSNQTVNASEDGFTLTKDMNSFTANPVPGRWHMVIVIQNPVSGTAFEQPFSGQVSGRPVGVSRGGLPNSTSTKLTRGTSTTYRVKVTNPGVQPIFVGVDPRLSTMATLQPVPIQGQLTFDLPPDPAKEPIYIMPPDTQTLTVAANSTTPAQLELQGSAAGFDLFGDLAAAQNGDSISVAKVSESGAGNYISRGIWFTNMQEIGPFTDAGAPSGQTTITASMRTLAFDSDVSSSTDDPYGNAVDPEQRRVRYTRCGSRPARRRRSASPSRRPARRGRRCPASSTWSRCRTCRRARAGLPQVTTGEVVATLPYSYKIS